MSIEYDYRRLRDEMHGLRATLESERRMTAEMRERWIAERCRADRAEQMVAELTGAVLALRAIHHRSGGNDGRFSRRSGLAPERLAVITGRSE